MAAWNPCTAYLATKLAGSIPWNISSTKSCNISKPAPITPTSFLNAVMTSIIYFFTYMHLSKKSESMN